MQEGPNATKTWIIGYEFRGTRRKFSLGPYEPRGAPREIITAWLRHGRHPLSQARAIAGNRKLRDVPRHNVIAALEKIADGRRTSLTAKQLAGEVLRQTTRQRRFAEAPEWVETSCVEKLTPTDFDAHPVTRDINLRLDDVAVLWKARRPPPPQVGSNHGGASEEPPPQRTTAAMAGSHAEQVADYGAQQPFRRLVCGISVRQELAGSTSSA